MHQLPVHGKAFAAALHDWQFESMQWPLLPLGSTTLLAVLLACKMNQLSQGPCLIWAVSKTEALLLEGRQSCDQTLFHVMNICTDPCVLCVQGVGTAQDIDNGMKLGTNQPMGPLQLADFIGNL